MSIFDEARKRISAGSSNTVNASPDTQNVFDQARSRISSGYMDRTNMANRIISDNSQKQSSLVDKATNAVGLITDNSQFAVNKPGVSETDIPGIRENAGRQADRRDNRIRSSVDTSDFDNKLAELNAQLENTPVTYDLNDPTRYHLKQEIVQLEQDKEAFEKSEFERLKAEDWERRQKTSIEKNGDADLVADLQRLRELEAVNNRWSGTQGEYNALLQEMRQKYGGDLDDWRSYVDRVENREEAKELQDNASAAAKEKPFWMSAASLPTNMASGIGFVDVAGQKLQRALTGSDVPVDYNTQSMRAAQATNAIRGSVSEKIEEDTEGWIGSDTAIGNIYSGLYNLGMSMGDSAVAAMTGTSALLAGSAATNAMLEAKERGATDEQAILFGLSSAAMEGVMEKMSIDSLVSLEDPKNAKQMFANFFKQGLVEAPEEIATSIANTAADAIIMGDKSQLNQTKNYYIQQGYTPEEAEKLALKEWGKGLLMDGLGGFVSGNVLAAARGIPSYVGYTTGANRMLSEKDLTEYLSVGKTKHTRDKKQAMLASGNSPILTSMQQVKDFISEAIHGKQLGQTKAYGVVGSRLADAVREKNSEIDISGYYLELTSDALAHAYKEHSKAKEYGDIDLSEEDFRKIPEYINDFDYVLSVEPFNGKKKIRIAKKINGYSVILETISSERKALHVLNMIGMSTKKFEKKYATKINAAGSLRGPKPQTVNTTAQHTDRGVSKSANNMPKEQSDGNDVKSTPNPNIAEQAENVNGSVGAADYGFSPYSNYQNTQSDFLPEGANAARPVDMPATDPTGQNTRRFAKTAAGAQAVPDRGVEQIERDFMDGKYGYEIKGDKQAVEKASALLDGKGFDYAYAQTVERLQDMKNLKQTVVDAQTLIARAYQDGRDADAAELCMLLAESGTEFGQAVQAYSIFRKLSPEGQLEGVRRAVERINEKITSKNKSFAGVEISNELEQKYREATSQEARDAVMEEIYEYVGKQIPTTFGEAANQWRYTAMLFNPSTHIKNMTGNLSMMAMKLGKDAVGAGIESVANAVTRGKTGRTKSVLNVFSEADRSLMQTAWADFENVKGDVAGIGKNKDNAMGKIGEHRDYWKLNDPQSKVAKALDATLRAAENVPKVNEKLMNAEDQIFAQPDYAISLAGYMKANNLTEITDEARAYAIKEAQKATFRDANAVSDFAKKMGNTNSKLWNGIVNTIFPFKGTPANVGVRAVEYSPAGLLTTIGKAVKASKDGTFKATDFIDDLSANLVGSALAAAGYFLAQGGWLRATGVGDEKEKEAQREAGYKDNSFILFGYSVPETMFTSASSPMFVGAALYEALATKAMDGDAYTIDDVLQALAATTDPLVGQTMLDGLSDTLYSVRSTQGGVGEWLASSAVNVAGNYIASYIPTLLSRVSAAADGVSRETYTDKNKPLPKVQKEIQDLMMKTPLRTKLPEKVDNYGRVQENWLSDSDTKIGNALGAIANVVTPTFPSKIQTTDVEAALQEIYRSGADTDGKKIFQTDAPKSIRVDGKDVNLTAEQYEKFEKLRGGNTTNYQAGLQNSKVFSGLPDDMQAYATDKMYDYIEQRSKLDLGVGYDADTWVDELRNSSPEKVAEIVVQKAVESMAGSDAYENKYDGLSNLLKSNAIDDQIALALMSNTAVDSYNAYCKDADVSVQKYAEVYGYMNKVDDLDATLAHIDKMFMPKAERVALAQAISAAHPKIIRVDNPVSEEWLLKHGATDAIVDQFSESRRENYDQYIKGSGVDMGDYLDIYNYRYAGDGHKQAEVIAEIDKLNLSDNDKISLFLGVGYAKSKIPNWWK